MHLKTISTPGLEPTADFPLSLPFIPSIRHIEIENNLLFFVGENGSGKSTLLESIALTSKRINIGRNELDQEHSLNEIKPLASALRLSWQQRTQKGFFLRAEDFFGFIRRNQELESEFDGYIDRFKDDDRVRGYMESNKRAINAKYEKDLNEYSHGEGFLTFFKSRISPGGLYLIDEPEAALSPQRQLAFALFVYEMAQQGCQFIIATHSPIILSTPNSQIWAFSENGIENSHYDELEHVNFTKNFLQDPARYWHQLLKQ